MIVGDGSMASIHRRMGMISLLLRDAIGVTLE
jgi:hypothetical protein